MDIQAIILTITFVLIGLIVGFILGLSVRDASKEEVEKIKEDIAYLKWKNHLIILSLPDKDQRDYLKYL